MWWRVVKSLSAHLPAPFVEDDFDFFSKTLSGTKELKPRWKRALSMTESALGEALAKMYVAKHFTNEAKAKALGIVERVRVALEQKVRSARGGLGEGQGRDQGCINGEIYHYQRLVVVIRHQDSPPQED